MARAPRIRPEVRNPFIARPGSSTGGATLERSAQPPGPPRWTPEIAPGWWTGTLNLLFRRYWAKVVVIYLVWTFSPTYPPRDLPARPKSTSAVCTASPFPLLNPSSSAVPAAPLLPRGATPFRETAERGIPVPSPLTPAYPSSVEPSTSSVPPAHAKGSTTRADSTSPEWSVTPALSEQPAASSARWSGVQERDNDASRARQLFRGMRRQEPRSGEAEVCLATPPRPLPRPGLTPFTYTLLALHTLFLLECLLANLETSPTLLNLPNTLPPPFSAPVRPPSRVPPPHRPSVAKRLSRLRWRTRTLWAQCGGALVCWVAVALALGVVSVKWCGNGAEGWNAVLGPAGWVSELRIAEGVLATKAGARGWAPLRNIVLLEVATVFLSLAHSITPLLIALGYLPPSIRVPSFLHPPPPSPALPRPFPYDPSSPPVLILPVLELTHRYLSSSLSTLLTLAQLVQLVLARPASSSLIRTSSLVWFFVVQARIANRVDAKDALGTHLAHVRELACTFPPIARGRRESGAAWTCAICFEGGAGVIPGEGETAGAEDGACRRRTIGYWTRCDLPCGHGFHAHCLARWFTLVASCPTCHADARPAPPAAASAATATADVYDPTAPWADLLSPDERSGMLMRMQGFADRVRAAEAEWVRERERAREGEGEGFPGARAGAGREGRRRRTVALPPLVTGGPTGRDEGEWEDVD